MKNTDSKKINKSN